MRPTPDPEELARAAARRLDAEHDSTLGAEVERALATPGEAAPPARFEAVSIAIASLLVSIAGLAWEIYRDLKEDRGKAREAAARAAIARRIRSATELPPGVTPEQRDRLIDAVLDELNRSE